MTAGEAEARCVKGVFVDDDYHGDARAGLRDALLCAVHHPSGD